MIHNFLYRTGCVLEILGVVCCHDPIYRYHARLKQGLSRDCLYNSEKRLFGNLRASNTIPGDAVLYFSQVPILCFMFSSVSRQPPAANEQDLSLYFHRFARHGKSRFYILSSSARVKVAFSVSPVCPSQVLQFSPSQYVREGWSTVSR